MLAGASLACVAAAQGIAVLPAAAATPAPYSQVPPGGKYKDCHGYVLAVSSSGLKVHCVDGTPFDITFGSFPDTVDLKDGTTMKTQDLKEQTPVHVQFAASLGTPKAYKIMLADPNATGPFGFKDAPAQ